MVDKPPPRFAPEGARFKRSDWQPEGSPADQQKRTYLNRIGDLEADLARRNAEVTDLTRKLQQATGKISDLEAVADEGKMAALQENVRHFNEERLRLQTDLNGLKKENGELRDRFKKQSAALTYARHIEAGARAKLVTLAVLGVVGTIWGSLGNPIPFTGSADKAAKLATEKRIQCILAARAKASNTGPQGMLIAEPERWLPNRPENLIQTKDLKFPDDINQVRLSDLKITTSGVFDISVNLTGILTNSSPHQTRQISGIINIMSLFPDGGCRPITSFYFFENISVAPQASLNLSLSKPLGSSLPDFDEKDVFITDLSIFFGN